MAVIQKHRSIRVISPLGDDVLWFYRMRASECLSQPFEYELEVLSDDPTVKPSDLLGQHVTVQLLLPDDTHRYFDGHVARFGLYGTVGVYPCYRLTLKPWFWLLTLNANCRIFQQKTVPDIVKQVFRDQGFSDFKEKLSGHYRVRDYCVQYRESDFNFVSRLLEEEGIYYFCTHEKGKHTLVLADSLSAHAPVAGYGQIPYFDPGNPERRKRDHIFELSFSNEMQPGNYALTDYDDTKPKTSLLVKAAIPRQYSYATFECFDYPGEYKETSDGEGYARCRIEEYQARFEQIAGRGNARGATTGALFKLTDYPRNDLNKDYLITSANYELQSDEYFGTRAGGNEDIYQFSFTAIDQNTPFRPRRLTVKPLVQGPQTAVVVGPAGEEIHTDKYGRVKVQFHWDRYGKKDENSSCWVRVSHPWAGKGWGSVSIPRIGQEVIVDFLEGDPDQPIITGRVYNADQMPPFGMPAGAVISGIKSNTHKGSGYNEFSMDDTAGKEKITIHGQYDMNTTVEHDQTTTVHNNRTDQIDVNDSLTVGSNQTITIGGHRSETVNGGEDVTINGTKTTTISIAEMHSVGAGRMHNVGAGEAITVGGAQAVNVGGAQTVSVGGAQIVSVGALQKVSVGGPHKLSAATINVTSKGTIKIKAGATTMIEAPTIVLKAGGSKIVMNSGGITIKGAKLVEKASGTISIKAGGSIKIKGSNIGED